MRRKLISELTRRKLALDLHDAEMLVANGRVLVSGSLATNPARLVESGESVTVTPSTDRSRRFASRAGQKLDFALDHFGMTIEGRRCLDIGASTGGFTSCLLSRGASQVTAIDVGYGLMDESVKSDPRVICKERVNIRMASLSDLGGEQFRFATADVSFLSLKKLASKLSGELLSPDGQAVLLVKPQFEATRKESSRTKGVIRSPEIWKRTVIEVTEEFVSHGMGIIGCVRSPVLGTKGNREFLLALCGSSDAARYSSLQAFEASEGLSSQFSSDGQVDQIGQD